MQSLAGYSSTIAVMLLVIGLKGLLKVDLRWYRNGMAEMRHSIVKGIQELRGKENGGGGQ